MSLINNCMNFKDIQQSKLTNNWLKQNGVTVIDVTDTVLWPIVELDPTDYRSVGFGCRVDTYLVFQQNPAPALAGWTWAPQTTA